MRAERGVGAMLNLCAGLWYDKKVATWNKQAERYCVLCDFMAYYEKVR